MDENFATDPSDNFRRIFRKWIILAGYVIAGGELSTTLLGLADEYYTMPYFHFWQPDFFDVLYRIFMIADLAWAIFLLCGCWGLHHHRFWARRILFVYSCLCIFTNFARQAVSFARFLQWWHISPQQWHLHQIVVTEIYNFFHVFVSSLFPILLILCLRRPELRDWFSPRPRGGFTPVLKNDPHP